MENIEARKNAELMSAIASLATILGDCTKIRKLVKDYRRNPKDEKMKLILDEIGTLKSIAPFYEDIKNQNTTLERLGPYLRSLEKIDVMHGSTCEILASASHQFPNLKKLLYMSITFSENNLESISTTLSSFRNLKKLRISSCKFRQEITHQFIRSFSECPIEELKFSMTPLNGRMGSIAQIIVELKKLKELELWDCGVDMNGFRELTKVFNLIPQLKTLKFIVCDFSKIPDNYVKSDVGLLHLKGLTKLAINSSDIRNSVMKEMLGNPLPGVVSQINYLEIESNSHLEMDLKIMNMLPNLKRITTLHIPRIDFDITILCHENVTELWININITEIEIVIPQLITFLSRNNMLRLLQIKMDVPIIPRNPTNWRFICNRLRPEIYSEFEKLTIYLLKNQRQLIALEITAEKINKHELSHELFAEYTREDLEIHEKYKAQFYESFSRLPNFTGLRFFSVFERSTSIGEIHRKFWAPIEMVRQGIMKPLPESGEMFKRFMEIIKKLPIECITIVIHNHFDRKMISPTGFMIDEEEMKKEMKRCLSVEED